MPDISPSLPIVGQPNSSEEPKIVTALSQLVAAVNDVDATQLAAAVAQALVPTGSLIATARITADTGYLFCDGSAVSRATYANLFTAIGSNFGVGDGSTTFNLPDMRGRAPVGVDNTGMRVLLAPHFLGQSGGEETHTLTIPEMPAHAHTPSGVPSSSAFWTQPTVGGTTVAAGSGGPGTFVAASNSTSSVGGGGAHNTMPPYLMLNYQIKT